MTTEKAIELYDYLESWESMREWQIWGKCNE